MAYEHAPTEYKTNYLTDENRQRLLNALHSRGAFQYMSQDFFNILFNKMKLLHFKEEQIIFKEGGIYPAVYIIVSGCVSIYVRNQFIYNLNRTGDVFGEIGFLTHKECTATIKVKKELHALAISQENLEKIGDEHFYIWLARVLADKVTRTSQRLG